MMGGGGSSSLYLKQQQLVSCKQHDTNKNMGAGFLDHRRHRNYYHYNISTKLDVGLTKLLLSISSVSSSYSTRSTTSSVSCLSLNGQHTTVEAETETVRVKFQLHRECSFGQNFLVTGDDPVLGLWDPNNAIPLTWSEGHLWTSAHLDIPIGKCIKFKFILMQESDGVIVWQPGPDRVLECFKTDKTMTLCEDWEDPDSRKIIIDEIEPSAAALNQEIHMVEPLLVSANNGTTEEPKVSATNMKLVSADEGRVPVLVPGLNQYQVEDSVINNVASNDYQPPESLIINGSAMLVPTEPDRAKDLILPDELDIEGDANTSNLNPRPEISSVPEIQDSRENEHQEIQQVTEEQVTVPPREHSPHNDVKWGHNAVQKLLSIFGIR